MRSNKTVSRNPGFFSTKLQMPSLSRASLISCSPSTEKTANCSGRTQSGGVQLAVAVAVEQPRQHGQAKLGGRLVGAAPLILLRPKAVPAGWNANIHDHGIVLHGLQMAGCRGCVFCELKLVSVGSENRPQQIRQFEFRAIFHP